jgi:hypothetical protein
MTGGTADSVGNDGTGKDSVGTDKDSVGTGKDSVGADKDSVGAWMEAGLDAAVLTPIFF